VSARFDRLRHDVRSPLSVIQGFANLLEHRSDDTFRLEATARIQQAASVLEQKLDALLSELESVAGETAPGDRRQILVADDDPAVRELLAATLDADSFAIVEARDVVEAVAMLADAPVLVILDWRFPGGGGEVVLAAAKERDPDLPVVVLTGDRTLETRACVETGGADAFITKPFSPLELLATVERLTRDPHA
jgi:CheY-like chemotaxis protein